jgi:hypothetical protein
MRFPLRNILCYTLGNTLSEGALQMDIVDVGEDHSFIAVRKIPGWLG